jgi:hypothetical protein
MSQLISILQIDQPFCVNTFGVEPCTATGKKCRNTFKTCRDTENYDDTDSVKTLSFHTACENPLLIPGMFPTLMSWSRTPGKLNIASADPDTTPLGVRERVTYSLGDHPYHDRWLDKYFRERDYSPMAQGKFWSKWLAWNDNYAGFECRHYQGFEGQTLDEMSVRHYQLDKITGPSSGDTVQIEVVDVLKSADNDRVKIPAVSSGFLVADIDDVATTFAITPESAADEYGPESTEIRLSIGDEKMVGQRVGAVFTVTRGSEAQSHDAGSIVQKAEHLPGERVESIVSRWLKDYVGTPAEWINDAEWADEAGTYLPTYSITATIYKPEGANKIIGELLRDCSAFLIPDVKNKKITFRAIREQEPVKTVTDDNEIILGSFSQARKPEMRLTQLWFVYSMRDEMKSLSDRGNFSHFFIQAGAGSERAKEQRIKEIYSRFLRPSSITEVVQTSSRIMERFGAEPVEYSFSLDKSDADGIGLGDVVILGHREITDDDGAKEFTAVQIVSEHEKKGGTVTSYIAQSYAFDFSATLWAPDDVPAWEDATDEQRAKYLFWSDENGEIDGENAPTWSK